MTRHQAQIIDGRAIAAAIREELAREIAGMETPPGLAVVLVGDDPASHVYVRGKIRACEEAGIRSFESRLPAGAGQGEVAAAIRAFNENSSVHGILLQLPVPAHLDSDALIQMIAPEKDVDGLTHVNIGRLAAGDPSGLVPCTPQGALLLLKHALSQGEREGPAKREGEGLRFPLEGKYALVIGRSLLFGKPMAQLLLAENCTLTQAHSKTPLPHLIELCKSSDILIAAAGRPAMVKGDWIRPGAIVIDVGINRLEDGSLCGDVAFDEAVKVASAITPVPGGVGPMTIACLLRNTLKAAKSVGF